MKNISLSIILLFWFINATAYNIEVWGTVMDASTQYPVANQSINISVDSLAGGFTYFNTVTTDESGYYFDTITINDFIDNGILNVSTDSCNTLIIREYEFSQINSSFYVPFMVCSSSPFDCNAMFTYYNDIPYKVVFENQSVGDISEYQWDFGDGSTSFEENPIHDFTGPGDYLITLFISGDSCYDQYQSIVSVYNDTSFCEAYYTWEQTFNLSKTINFYDQSFGEVNSWFWDFGDGTSSNEQNPQHTYNSFGSYPVTLSINTLDSCFSSYTEILYINVDTTNCQASFTYYLDTLNNTPHTYQFTDQSTSNIIFWYWDFGDGNFSYQKDPVHTYDDSGEYNVCLTVATDIGNQYCTDYTCTLVSTMEYYYFGGQIFAGDYPINIDSSDNENIARVSLYRKIDNSWYFMDEGEFWKYGYYWFYDKPQGEYLVFAELTGSSLVYNDYCPSYYPNSINWKSSYTFTLNNNESYAVNISLHPLTASEIGIGSVQGTVLGDQSCNNLQDLNLNNVTIQLFNNEGNIIDYAKPDTNAQYRFSNLAFGNYTIKAEYPGKYSETYTITIDDKSSSIDQNLLVFCQNILGLDENPEVRTFNLVNIFPNPASTQFSITIESFENTTIEMQILDINGHIIDYNNYNIRIGDNKLNYDSKLLNEGYYLIKVTDKTSNYQVYKKLIVIN